MSKNLIARCGAVAALAATLVVGASNHAEAAPAAKPSLLVSYDVTGTTTLSNPNSAVSVKFAPTKLSAAIKDDATFTANLPLAPVASSFKAYGFLPTRGTVVFTQVRPITGVLAFEPGQPLITSSAQYVVSLRDVAIGGAKANVGTNCQTTFPVRVTVATDPDFDISIGGSLRGSYTLSKFQNCGAAQKIINDTLPGAGNTLEFVFSNGQISNAPGAITQPRP